MDPGRDEWKAWTSFRNDIAKEWNPDNLKAVAFVLNRVRSLLGMTRFAMMHLQKVASVRNTRLLAKILLIMLSPLYPFVCSQLPSKAALGSFSKMLLQCILDS